MNSGEWRIEQTTSHYIVGRPVENNEGTQGEIEYLCHLGNPVTFGSEITATAVAAMLNAGTVAPANQDRRRVRLEIRYRKASEQDDENLIIGRINQLSYVDSVEVVE